MALTFIDPDYKDTLTVVPRTTSDAGDVVRIITEDGMDRGSGNHVIDLSLSDVKRLRDALTAHLESANADT
jgi:hypothetical protein